jgi:Tfp pilus assembly protein PilV
MFPAAGAISNNWAYNRIQVKNMKKMTRQSGVGLIEVLVAGIVFAVGIAAVLQLQGKFFKNSGSASARVVAMGIAQEKLEDLRSFQLSNSTDVDVFGFNNISGDGAAGGVAEAGGRCTEQNDDGACTLSLSATTVTVGNTVYTRTWAVTNYYLDSAGGLCTPFPTGTVPNTCVAATTTIPDQKRVLVTVTWRDSGDTSDQALTLEGLINSNSSAAASGGFTHNVGGSGEKPVVIYTPSTDTEVVSVGVGSNNTKRETLIPTSNGSEQVKFTAYTYTSSGTLLRQEDFLTVSCNCAFTTAGQARTASFAKWNASTGSYKDIEGDLISKDKGCVTNGNNASCVNNADELCTSCCGDHHDPGSSAVDSSNVKYCDPANGILDRCFDPFRGSSDFNNGKHKHYTSNGTLASSGQYLESCRMKRINGFWRVYQDWHRVDLSAFPLSTLASSTDEATYATYIGHIVDDILNDTTLVLDTSDTSTTTHGYYGQTFTNTLSATKPTLANRTSSNPVEITTNQQLHLTARSLYVDYLSPSLLTQIRAKKVGGSDYLIHVPFYEVDVTNRAPKCASATNAYGGWCPPGSAEVDVGTGNIANNQSNGLDAGVIKGVSATTSPVNVSFAFRRSNSGLMGLSDPVDVADVDHSDKLRDTALVAVSVTGAGAGTHTLVVSLSGDTPTSGSLSFTPASGTGDTCVGSGTSYSCIVANGVAGSLSFTGSNGTDSCTGTGTYTASNSNTQNVSLIISCTPPAVTTHTLTVTLNPTGGTPVTGTLLSTKATACAGSGTSYACTELDTASGAATLTYSGATSTGSVCSGTGTYTASTTAQTVTLAVTCTSTRVLFVCLTKDNFTTGALTATPSGGSAISCSAPSGACGSGANTGTASSCTVTSGVTGVLSFTGTASGNKTCAVKSGATDTYGVNDSQVNLEIACN